MERSDLEEALAEQNQLRSRRVGEILAEKADGSSDHRRTGHRQCVNGTGIEIKTPFRVGDILVEAGLVTTQQVNEALREQNYRKT